MYRVYYRGVFAYEFDDVITAYFEKNGVRVGSILGYSINTYIYKKQADTNEKLVELLKAIYNYGESAKKYYMK